MKSGTGAIVIAMLIISMALVPVASATKETQDEDIGIKSTQYIDITAQKVQLYVAPDAGDNTGEIYAQYTTDEGDFNVKTGTISVLKDTEESFVVSPYEWTDLRYAADSLHVLVWDDDTLSGDDKLFDAYKTVSSGVYVWSNSNVKLTTYVDVHW
ncbi:hypothetical protein [Methanolobus sp.]|uniref:hypothetical protein n=1 Tax=Methanolobus sp. TaxID=1874737 RepID=UPI00258D0F41|nr:hypothetical protein [Methanolobus sp.]